MPGSGVLRFALALLVAGAPAATSDLVCANHRGHEAAAAADEMPPEHQHGAPAKAPPCDRQTLAECCPMLVTCTVSFLDERGETLASVGFDVHPVTRIRDVALLTRASPPDPPPPRA